MSSIRRCGALSAMARMLTAFVAIGLASTGAAGAQEGMRSRQLRVAMLEVPRIVFTNAAGKPDGFGVDVLALALAEQDIQITYVRCSRESAYELLLDGELDLVFPISSTEERLTSFDFSKSILISTWGTVYALPGNQPASITDVSGKRVAGLSGSLFANEFGRLNDDLQLGAVLQLYSNYDDVFDAVRNQEADVAVGPNTSNGTFEKGEELIPSPIVFAPAPGRFMVAKGSNQEILAALDRWLSSAIANPDSAYWRLQDQWFSGRKADRWMRQVGLLSVIFGGVAMLALLFVIALRRQVRARTSELAQKNRALREEIKKRECAQAALLEREQLVNGIFENLIFVAFLKEPKGRYILVNKEFQRYVGLSERDIVGKNDSEIFDTTFADGMRAADAIAIRDGRATLERVVRVGDEDRHLFGVRFPLRDAEGKPYLICGLSIDVTDQKRAEAALRQREQMLRDVINLVPHAIWAVDASYRVVLANKATALILGVEQDAMIGQPLERFLTDPAQRTWLMERVELFVHGEEWQEEENEWVDELGNRRVYHTSSRRFRTGGQNELAALVVSADITELKSAQDALAAQQRDLEILVEQRTAALKDAQEELLRKDRLALIGQLTATLSHELRNPLATIRGSVYILEQRFREAEGGSGQTFDRIARNIDRCDRIIAELLDYARARELVRERVELTPWLTDILEETNIPQGIAVETSFAPACQIFADPERLRRCVQNILLNACQAMENNGDRPRCLEIQSWKDDADVYLRVTDSGEGMEESQLARVFEPLYSTKSYGIGLGLPLARQIIELHGGDILVHSAKGVGTEITLRLPLQAG